MDQVNSFDIKIIDLTARVHVSIDIGKFHNGILMFVSAKSDHELNL
jgi:hypothetical protein